MSWPDIARVLEQARELGCRSLFLGGGEPLVAPHVAATLRHARGLGYEVNLTTNGSLLAAQAAALAPDVDRLSVSLDYPDERHDELRGRPGLFREVVDGVLAARRYETPTRLTANVFRGNVEALEALASLARELDCPLHARLLTRESTTLADDTVLTSPEERRAAADEIERLRRLGYPIATPRSYTAAVAGSRPFPCRIARFVVNVDARGRVYLPCPHHEGSKDRILGVIDERHALRDIWYGEAARVFRAESLVCRPGSECYSACIHDISRLLEPDLGFWAESLVGSRSLGAFYRAGVLRRSGRGGTS